MIQVVAPTSFQLSHFSVLVGMAPLVVSVVTAKELIVVQASVWNCKMAILVSAHQHSLGATVKLTSVTDTARMEACVCEMKRCPDVNVHFYTRVTCALR